MDAGTKHSRDDPPRASRTVLRSAPMWPAHGLAILSLALLAALVQSVVITRAVVPALDAVRYVAKAKQITSSSVTSELLHSADEEPLFPTAVAGVYGLLEPWLGPRRDGWALAAQFASALALVLTAPLVYLLALPSVDRRGACLAAAFFCVLPELARLGGDGIADSHGLLLCAFTLASSLLLSTRVHEDSGTAAVSSSDLESNGCKLRRNHSENGRRFFRVWIPVVGGLSAAASLLVGQASLVLLVAIIAMAIRPAWRSTALFMLAGCTLAIGTWYAFGLVVPEARTVEALTVEGVPNPLPVKESTTSIRFHGYGAAILAAARALPRTLHYVLLPLAIWGLLATWHARPTRRELIAFVLLFVVLYLNAAVYYAARTGYLEPRHLIPVTLVLLPWSAAGTIACAEAIANAFALPQRRNVVCAGVAALILTACLLQTTKPLHGRRTPHRDAAHWLVANAQADDCVLDSRGWTGLLSGHTSFSFHDSAMALAEPRLRYLVIERHELRYASERSRLLAQLVSASDGPPIEFASPTGDRGQDVLVVQRSSMARGERVAWHKSLERDELPHRDP